MTDRYEPGPSAGNYLLRAVAPAAEWSWILVLFLMPIDGNWLPVPLAIAVVLGLVNTWSQCPVLHWKLLWPLFAFYALHVVGMAWTQDVDFGLFDLQIKLALVLVPLAVAALPMVQPDFLRRGMVAFTAGFGVAILLGLAKAWLCYSATGEHSCFSQSMVSFQLHPSYAAWYGCWSIAYWGYALASGSLRTRTALALTSACMLLFAVFVMMLASKSGVIGLSLIMIGLVVVMVRRQRGQIRWIMLSGVAVLGVAAIWAQGDLVWERMEAATHAVGEALRGDPSIYSDSEGSSMRIVAWTCSWENLREHPFGAGTGDIKHALMACYVAKDAKEAAVRNLNSHCQFLQSGTALGWLGLILAVAIGVVPLFRQGPDQLLRFLALLYIINAAVESVLEVQAGVVFMGAFLGLLAQRKGQSISRPSTP